MTLWLVAVLIGAGGMAGALTLRGGGRFGLLAGLLLAGAAGRQVLLKDLYFPHIDPRPVSALVVVAAALLLAQAVGTLWVLWHARKAVWSAVNGRRAAAGVCLLALLSVLSVSPTPYVAYGPLSSWAVQIVLGGMLAGLSLATVVAMLAVPAPRLPVLPARAVAPVAAGVAGVASALLAVFAFQGVPHVGDDLAYLFQAKTYAHGLLSVPAPPEALRAGLDYYLIEILDGRWLSTTAPGWPLVLTLGVLAGLPWLVNPVLTALTVLWAHGAVRAATEDRALADRVAWLMASSPWVLAMGGSLMTHTLALALLVLAWRCLVAGRALRGTLSPGWALAAGLAMGWLFTTRAFEGVILGGLTGFALLCLRPLPWRGVVAYGLGCFATGVVVFLYNWVMTGHPLDAPLANYLTRVWPETSNGFGFGPDRGPPAGTWRALDYRPGHALDEAVVNLVNGLASLNLELFGWSTGSVLAVGLVLFGGYRRIAAARFLGLCWLAVVGALFFYWFAGTFYIGPRYWFIVCLPVVVASAAGVGAVVRQMPEGQSTRPDAVLMVLCLMGLLVFTPWRGVDKYYNFRGNADHVAGAAFGNALVFVTTDRDVQAVLSRNDPLLPADRPIFLRDLGPEARAAALAAMPGRDSRRITITDAGWSETP